jgi:hypothetical protein
MFIPVVLLPSTLAAGCSNDFLLRGRGGGQLWGWGVGRKRGLERVRSDKPLSAYIIYYYQRLTLSIGEYLQF